MGKDRFAILGVIAALGLAGCSSNHPVTAAEAAPAPAATQQATAKPASNFYSASGPLVVENQVDVASQREGVVAKILADVGAPVHKGQLLALLDDRQITADRDAAKAKAEGTKADYQHWQAELKMRESDAWRSEQMWKANLITKQQMEHDQYAVESGKFYLQRQGEDLKNAEAALKALDFELDKTRILAPFDGIVARRYVRAGQKVALGDRIFWVTATSPLNVRFTLPQEFVKTVKVGSEVQVSTAFAPELQQAAKVMLVSPVVDPSSGTIEVQAQVQGPPGELRPGMTVNVRVKTQ
ncbi:MAG: efflux RND transporter periplasmic adaptor subunit [Terriglobales bacterium]